MCGVIVDHNQYTPDFSNFRHRHYYPHPKVLSESNISALSMSFPFPFRRPTTLPLSNPLDIHTFNVIKNTPLTPRSTFILLAPIMSSRTRLTRHLPHSSLPLRPLPSLPPLRPRTPLLIRVPSKDVKLRILNIIPILLRSRPLYPIHRLLVRTAFPIRHPMFVGARGKSELR